MSNPVPGSASRTVLVCSGNPVKLKATEQGFQRMFPNESFIFKTLKVPSGVPDQPFSDEETLRGALNRAQTARTRETDADFWVGLEGGVDDAGVKDGPISSLAWIVVLDKDGTIGKARTAAYFLPQETSKLLRDGVELARADEIIHHTTNSRQKNGSVGLLTGDVSNRTDYYTEAGCYGALKETLKLPGDGLVSSGHKHPPSVGLF